MSKGKKIAKRVKIGCISPHRMTMREAAACGRMKPKFEFCGASMDGETCRNKRCPQTKDGEPEKSGRSCPWPHPREFNDLELSKGAEP